ncbi:hypothetical protein SHELI_v1c10450 [Spiroplasma helicoides]|uniref:Lipoprotein n=1 Tax=Spiroplasma helicoides TaxID=216938 RepID=A0A1B3SM40_9MOLU|nr:hypothetical protein [Spiroplasma helicoides]AOG60992.1 hypothetical protein SHELI_v1c10450 [Spiroplasma helicoides]
MKKLLKISFSFCLTLTSTSFVLSCKQKRKSEQTNFSNVFKDFEMNVNDEKTFDLQAPRPTRKTVMSVDSSDIQVVTAHFVLDNKVTDQTVASDETGDGKFQIHVKGIKKGQVVLQVVYGSKWSSINIKVNSTNVQSK